MTKIYGAVLLMLFFSLGGCSRVHVTAQYDKNTDFSRYQTFSFVPMRPADNTSRAFSPENQASINQAITQQLEARHYRHVEQGGDLLVSNYLATADKQKNVTYAGVDHSYYGGYGYATRRYDTVYYRVGTLVIDLVDTKQNQQVWQGVGTKTLTEKSKDPKEAITRAVEKIFRQYPVKPGSDSK